MSAGGRELDSLLTSASAVFAGLSLADVLEARDAYHVHLVRQRHVVATAVGRYLVRTNDPEDSDTRLGLVERLALPPGQRSPRTLQHSAVRPWSWPCVLVFVDHWMGAEEIRDDPDQMVPRRLYLPDGRMVPTCVVYVPPSPGDTDRHLPATLSFPTALFGGGYACVSEVQGEQRAGTIACLVTDGRRSYALTNQHVAGQPGQPINTLINGNEVLLGHGGERSVSRIEFEQAYPGLRARRTEVAVDAGLIDIDDLSRWSTRVFGIGRLAAMVDLGPETLSLALIGQPLRAFGAASGPMSGELTALYYRFRTRSGVEYVADAIVGPRDGQPTAPTRPGDSGTLWVHDPAPAQPAPAGSASPVHDSPDTGDTFAAESAARPVALQWGGHHFADDAGAGATTPYALVSFLSTVCRALDVEPLVGPGVEPELYWGPLGHYTVGARACDLVTGGALRDFFVANRTRIAFDLDTLVNGDYETSGPDVFHPLADVPDTVWKAFTKGWRRGKEGPNHFADMDDPLSATDDRTLMSMFEADPASVNPTSWYDFYETKKVKEKYQGLLPFRVAQLYRLIVSALAASDITTALGAAGIMAHYVGDACQPLHASRWHDGRTKAEEGVHSGYETTMVSDERAAIAAGLDTALANPEPLEKVSGHREAAVAVVALMHRTIGRLPPETLLDAWVTTSEDAIRGHSTELWRLVGATTIDCIADGCRTLAMIWSSAWDEAHTAPPAAEPVSLDKLQALYLDASFAPSMYLAEHIGTW